MALPSIASRHQSQVAPRKDSEPFSGKLVAQTVTLNPCNHILDEDAVIAALAKNKLCPLDQIRIEGYNPIYTSEETTSTSSLHIQSSRPFPLYVSQAQTLAGKGKALITAIENGDEKSVGYLLNHDALLTVTNRKNQTALQVACEMKNLSILTLLIQNHASLGGDDARAALLAATENQDSEIVKCLVNNGAPLMDKPIPYLDCVIDSIQQTPCFPLYAAVSNGDLDLVEFFLSTENLPNGLKMEGIHFYGRKRYTDNDYIKRSVKEHAMWIACAKDRLSIVQVIHDRVPGFYEDFARSLNNYCQSHNSGLSKETKERVELIYALSLGNKRETE